MNPLSPDIAGIAQATQSIRAGGVVAYPTETVYGLGADPFSPAAIDRLFRIKERDRGKPVLLIVAGEEQLLELVADISPVARALMSAFWPGPLSLLFPRSGRIPSEVTGGHAGVCVRCTSHPIARDLCLATGHAITSTSANIAGMPPALTVADCALPGVDYCIDAGTLEPSPPSTVFDPDRLQLIRPGVISEAAIRDVLRKAL
jgi:L-threonylcarbamoyladenylate synthase